MFPPRKLPRALMENTQILGRILPLLTNTYKNRRGFPTINVQDEESKDRDSESN